MLLHMFLLLNEASEAKTCFRFRASAGKIGCTPIILERNSISLIRNYVIFSVKKQIKKIFNFTNVFF